MAPVPALVLLILLAGCAMTDPHPISESTAKSPPAPATTDARPTETPTPLPFSPPIFRVDPALHAGHPSVVAEVDPAAPPLVFRVSSLDNSSETLDTRVFRGESRIEYRLPDVPRDTYVTLVVKPERADATLSPANDNAPSAPSVDSPTTEPEPLFVWNALLRPEGAPLIDYTGHSDDMSPPDDFDAYWARAVAELDAFELLPRVTRVPEKDTPTGLLHRVELPAVRDTTLVCWYYVPRAAFDAQGRTAKRHPAVIIMPGYGAEQPPMDRTDHGLITLSINPRNHGPSKDFWKSPAEHLVYNIDDPENYYYKLAFLDCLQGARFVLSRPEAHTDRVAAEGGSQGGLFALALAALEPRIACVCSNVTAFSDYPDGMALARIGHHTTFRRRLTEAAPDNAEKIRLSLRYTDGANMATRVRCPVQFCMGGQDPVCPYPCGVVCFNRLPKDVEKEIHIIPDAKHEVPPPMREHNRRWYRQWLGVE